MPPLLTRARRPLADSIELQEEPSAGKLHARIREGKAEWLRYSTIALCGASSWSRTSLALRVVQKTEVGRKPTLSSPKRRL